MLSRLMPPRFLAFLVIAIAAIPAGMLAWSSAIGLMAGFDVAATVFLLSCLPLLRDATADSMRAASRRNDANRALLLGIGIVASFAVLAAVAAELGARGGPAGWQVALVIATLLLAFLFGNTVFALHYAHLYYLDDQGEDCAGLGFPETKEPIYWDFVYFAFTLGMTFQTSDTAVQTAAMRRIVIGQCMTAFVFNLGILGFTINVLGSLGH